MDPNEELCSDIFDYYCMQVIDCAGGEYNVRHLGRIFWSDQKEKHKASGVDILRVRKAVNREVMRLRKLRRKKANVAIATVNNDNNKNCNKNMALNHQYISTNTSTNHVHNTFVTDKILPGEALDVECFLDSFFRMENKLE